MNPLQPNRLRACILAALLHGATGAGAIESGQAAGGQPYMMGGIGQEEIAMLDLVREQFNLCVRTALRGSGEYLSDVRLRIADAEGRVLFDRDLDGPELLIRLEPGRYVLEASWSSKVQRAVTVVNPTGQRDVVFHFDPGPAGTRADRRAR